MRPLLSGADIRRLADEAGVHPTKKWGQNFVVDPNTVRRIVETAGVGPADLVLEVGPGLGSLTLPLLDASAGVVAVEVDPVLAGQLPRTVSAWRPEAAGRLRVVAADALRVTRAEVGEPSSLVANLPYNVSVPVLLHLLAEVTSLRTVLVMVQREVAERLAAPPGSRTYGVPSAKIAWYGSARLAGAVPRSVFWPVPNVDSALVRVDVRQPPKSLASRDEVFTVVDAAFGQRRKMLRSALAGWAGSSSRAEELCRVAGIDPTARGETLPLSGFVAIADAAVAV